MKLFLSSKGISDNLIEAFSNFVEKPLGEVRLALIENAADPYPEERKGFVYEARERWKSLGLQITQIDLRNYDCKNLASFDIVWFGGGNAFYLRWLIKETGLDKLLPSLLKKGILYGGESAGGVVAGPSLEFFDNADDPTWAPEVIEEGLGLIEMVIIPHWGTEKYATILQDIKKRHDALGNKTVTLTDKEAIIVKDNEWKKIS